MSDEEKKEETPQEETPAEEKEVKDPVEEEKEPLPEDPHEMTEEQLDEAEESMIDEETGEVKEPEEKPAEEKPTGEEKPAEGEDKPVEEEEKPPEKKYDVHGNEVTGDPLKDTQADLQRERDKRIDAERKLEEAQFKGFEKLSEDDEEVLKEEDPEGFLVYKEKERNFETHTAKLLDDDINDAHQANRDSVINFVAGRLELDPNNPNDQERVLATLRNKDSEETQMMIKLDNYLSENVKPVKSVKVDDKNFIPVYSQAQLDTAYKVVYHDDIISTKEKAVREDTINKLKEAGDGGSAFDRVGKGDEKPHGQKKIDEYSQEEIYNMDEAEADRVLKQVDTG